MLLCQNALTLREDVSSSDEPSHVLSIAVYQKAGAYSQERSHACQDDERSSESLRKEPARGEFSKSKGESVFDYCRHEHLAIKQPMSAQ